MLNNRPHVRHVFLQVINYFNIQTDFPKMKNGFFVILFFPFHEKQTP